MHNRILTEKREMSDAIVTHISVDLDRDYITVYSDVYLYILTRELAVHGALHDQLREDSVLQDKK